MKDYLVRTHDNKMEYRSKCIRTDGNYYLRDVDIVKIEYSGENYWLKKKDKQVVYSLKLKKFIHVDYRHRYTVLDTNYNKTTDEFDCNYREAFIDGVVNLATKRFVKNLKLDVKSGIYYDSKKESIKPRASYSYMYSNLHYSYEQQAHLFKKFSETSNGPLDKLNPGFTFGVEIETSNGIVPSNKLLEYGILPLRDGSTPNYEFVTKPLHKIESLLPIISSIANTCEYDISTSIHCHIGNVPTSPEFIVKFYEFMYNIQDSVFKMFPKYKSKNTLGIKRREYTMPLPELHSMSDILEFLNNGKDTGQVYKGPRLDHHADTSRSSKWRINSRYYWVNLIPTIFYPSRTIEFRIHQGSLNKYKIVYWLLMSMAFVEYCKVSKDSRAVAINTIFEEVYPESVADALIKHYEDMSSYYANYDEVGDLGYNTDIIDDKTYEPRVKLF